MWRFAHSQHFLAAAKAQDFAPFTRVTLIATAIILLSAVLWDDALDPVHGFRNLGLRGLQCALVLCWALLSGRNPRNVGARTVPVVVEALFMVCLTRLAGIFHTGLAASSISFRLYRLSLLFSFHNRCRYRCAA